MKTSVFDYENEISTLGKIPNKRLQRVLGRVVEFIKEWAFLTTLALLVILSMYSFHAWVMGL